MVAVLLHFNLFPFSLILTKLHFSSDIIKTEISLDKTDIPVLESVVDEFAKWISEELEEVIAYDETKLQILQTAVTDFAATIKPVLSRIKETGDDANLSDNDAATTGNKLNQIYNNILPVLKPHLTLLNFPQLTHRNGILTLLSKVVGISLSSAYSKLAEIINRHNKLKPLSNILLKQ
jgi:hypothetical protein